MSLLGIILLILLVGAVLPTWPYSRDWGYRPTGIVGIIVIILIVVMLTRGGI